VNSMPNAAYPALIKTFSQSSARSAQAALF
jgi:hypothetical protein